MFKKKDYGSNYGEKWAIAVALMDKPLHIDEIENHFSTIGRRLGIFNINSFFGSSSKQPFKKWLEGILLNMKNIEWIVESDMKYELTETGRIEAEKAYAETEYTAKILNKALNPDMASRVTFVVHLLLTAIKLPTALLSGSIGLLSDSLDTLADALSSLFVWVGIRKKKEKTANAFLVILMLATGMLTLGKAISRIFNPTIVVVDAYTFIAVLLSAIICIILFIYQRYTGLKTNTPTLITQSIDSRNHVIAAISVLAGLIAAGLNFVWLDIAVGLAFALLICKSAVELLVDLIKGANGEESKNSKFIPAFYIKHKDRACRLWIMNIIRTDDISSTRDLVVLVKEKFDTSDNRTLMAFNKEVYHDLDSICEKYVNDLISNEYITKGQPIRLTAKGELLLENKEKSTHSHILKNLKTACLVLWYIAEFTLLYTGISYISNFLNLELIRDNNLYQIGPNLSKSTVLRFITIGAGLYLYSYGRYHLKKVSTLCKHIEGNKLLTEGYYRKVRHPLYSMLISIQIGILSVANYRWTALLSIMYFLIIYLNTVFEEKQMIEIHKDKYLKYMANTSARLFSMIHLLIVSILLINNIATLVSSQLLKLVYLFLF